MNNFNINENVIIDCYTITQFENNSKIIKEIIVFFSGSNGMGFNIPYSTSTIEKLDKMMSTKNQQEERVDSTLDDIHNVLTKFSNSSKSYIDGFKEGVEYALKLKENK